MIDIQQDIVLENDRSRLEPLQVDHYDSLKEIALLEEGLLRYSPSRIDTPEFLQSFLNLAIREREQGTRYGFAIYDKISQRYAGSTSFLSISNPNQRVEIGWTWIGRAFQRTGLNRNNKLLMLEYGFEQCQCQRIELKTDSRNEQSKTAMTQIGAIYEGTLRSHTLMTDGYRRDTAYYSILADEWPSVKEKLVNQLIRPLSKD